MNSMRVLKIEKPTDNRFHIWKHEVEFALVFRKLHEILADAEPLKIESEEHEWKKLDIKAKAVIASHSVLITLTVYVVSSQPQICAKLLAAFSIAALCSKR